MISMIFITLLLVLLCVGIHVKVLIWLRRQTISWSQSPIVKLGFIVFTLLVTHIVEIMLFATVFYVLIAVPADFGTLEGPGIEELHTLEDPTFGDRISQVIYFSFATYTTVGYGDVTPKGPMQVLAQVEALTGLLLVGCSASLVFTFLQEFLAQRDRPASR